MDCTKPRAKRKLLAIDDSSTVVTAQEQRQQQHSSVTQKPVKAPKMEQPSSDPKQEEAATTTNPFLEIQKDQELRKKVVLKMALQRQTYDEAVRQNPDPVSSVITEGFFWRDYPPCEQVLYDNMAEYYDLSSGQRQSKTQVRIIRIVTAWCPAFAVSISNVRIDDIIHTASLQQLTCHASSDTRAPGWLYL